MRTSEAFLDSLNDGRSVYYRGEKVEAIDEHPILRIAAKHASKLYETERAYWDERLKQDISKFFKIPLDSEDLDTRRKLVYDTTMHCNGVFNISQAIGSDALFALTVVCKKVDKKFGTTYADRVGRYFDYVATNDLTLAVAQTDVKGDRRKRPHEQDDPDMYMHVVGRDEDGIIVRGAKAHTTQSAVADEIIVLPTRAMAKEDADYSLAFAVPASTRGLKMIVRPIEELEGNSSPVLSKQDFESETLTIFDDVHVPWDRVFLAGEYEFGGALALLFATFHRFTAISYRAATANLYLGAASLVAKSNGVIDAPHVRDELASLIMYKETMKMSALAAASEANIDDGIAIPNPLYTNIGKLYSNQNFPLVLAALNDIAGGIIATLPSDRDFENEEEKGYITKYLRGAVPGKERLETLKVAKELAASSFTGYMMNLMIHAEGSVQASKISLIRDYSLAEPEGLIRRITSEAEAHDGADAGP